MPSKSRDEDRDFQIELTSLQIRHEHDISLNTVFLSVFVSMMLTTVSVYIPLAQVTGNQFYYLASLIFNLVLMFPIGFLAKRVSSGEKRLQKDIEYLKKRFLPKRADGKDGS